ncbi:MAG TPA: fluoride efflux transporter CrcB [Alphaproteobacteria bacterium]|nr:fluoride efflux transporter CrcB [Alphaproteobacteria bacterium]
MTPAMILAAAMGGAVGSVARYVLGFYFGKAFGSAFPWGTLAINITGSFLIGAFAESFALRWNADPATRIFLITGICGGYTTFSAFSLEVVAMINRGAVAAATSYIVSSVVLSIGALYAALFLLRRVYS